MCRANSTARRWGWWGAAAALLGLLVASAPASLAVGIPLVRAAMGLAQVAVLLLMPGLALLLWLRPLEHLDTVQLLCLAPLVSLAIYPLLLFWMGLAGGAWSAAGVRVFLAVCTALVASRGLWAGRRVGAISTPPSAGEHRGAPWLARLRAVPAGTWLALALGAVFVLALGVRLDMVRGVLYPAWVDSYQHTIITQIILDTGRVPANYHPYASLDTFLYHFGYHAYSAFVSWATELPAHRAVLWGGQVLNALTVPSVFLIVDRLARDRRAALAAAIVAGLFSRMPAFYVNWGRYPQLAGQVLLPAAIVLSAEAVAHPRMAWRSMLGAALVVGGLALTHYRITIFYLVAMLVLVLSAWRSRAGQRPATRGVLPWLLCWAPAAARLALVGAGALALISPWLPAFVAKTVSTAQQVLATSNGGQYDYISLDFVLGYGLRPALLIGAAAAALWALARAHRRPLGVAVLLWLGLMVFLANPVVSGMPSGFLPNGTLIIALYLPAALLVGLALGDGWTLLEKNLRRRHLASGSTVTALASQTSARTAPCHPEVLRRVSATPGKDASGYLSMTVCGSTPAGRWLAAGMSLLLVALAGWGAYWLGRTGIDPWRYLVTPADVQAMAWVEANTPVDASFAVAGDMWLEAGVTGHDAGLWLPYVARRRTLVPPVIYISEGDPGYVAQTASGLAQVYEAASPEALADALHSLGADYVYRSVRTPQPWQAHLEDEAFFQRIYSAGGVRVYRVLG